MQNPGLVPRNSTQSSASLRCGYGRSHWCQLEARTTDCPPLGLWESGFRFYSGNQCQKQAGAQAIQPQVFTAMQLQLPHLCGSPISPCRDEELPLLPVAAAMLAPSTANTHNPPPVRAWTNNATQFIAVFNSRRQSRMCAWTTKSNCRVIFPFSLFFISFFVL